MFALTNVLCKAIDRKVNNIDFLLVLLNLSSNLVLTYFLS